MEPFTRLMSDAGGRGGRGGEGSLGSDRVGTLSVVRKHELMPRFP